MKKSFNFSFLLTLFINIIHLIFNLQLLLIFATSVEDYTTKKNSTNS